LRQSFFKNILSELRQWCYPREFRIDFVTFGIDDEKINDLIRSLAETVESLSSPEFQSRLTAQTALDDEPFITDLVTRLWRVRQCLRKPGSEEPVEGTDRGYRHLERLFSNLEQSGIRIMDKTGTFYDPGMATTVVSSEPMDGIGREIIKETVRPAIFRGDRLIQTSQVVVGIPSIGGDGSKSPQRPESNPEPAEQFE
jgi:hypothetical protein